MNFTSYSVLYSFQKAMKDYGVADLDVFQTVDLYNKKDISQVTTTLFALGRTVSTQQTRNTIMELPKNSNP